MGINPNKIDSIRSDWDQHNFLDSSIESGAPADAQYIPVGVTNGRFGSLALDQYSGIRVAENFDAEYAFVT